MAVEWKTVPLSSIATVRSGKRLPFGNTLTSVRTPHPYVRLVDVVDNRISKANIQFLRPDTHAAISRYIVRTGDVCLAIVGHTIGLVFQVGGDWDGANLTENAARLTDFRGADATFVFNYLRSQVGQNLIKSRTVGSAQGKLPLYAISALPVLLPPLSTQVAISHILSSLDSMIELNRRMNETLEGIARAFFQSWFVDFDPVRAKLDGRTPYGMDQATADLFPDSFVDSELGPIPKDWEVATVKDRTSLIQYGLTTSASTQSTGPKFLRITDIRGGQVSWQSVPYCSASDGDSTKYKLVDGDIVIARTGASTGENTYIVAPPDSAVFASYLIRLQFSSRGIGRVVGSFTRSAEYANYVSGILGGSAQPNANAQALAGASFAFPPESVAEAYYNILRPIDLLRASSGRQTATLAHLRDTLLPKLLSGELSVDEAGRCVEQSV